MARCISKLYSSATGQAVLLFLYLFLVMASYVVGKVSRDALFLDQFEPVQLPYADIAIAILVGFVVAAYVRLGRGFRLDKLLIISLAGYAATSVGFWWLGTQYHFAWLYPVVYVWIGVLGVLATAQVWTLANYVFTAREAKSGFGIVGSGAIAGWITGGYLSKALAGRFGAESLLLVMAAALTASIGLVILIWRGLRPEAAAQNLEVEPEKSGLAGQLREIWTMPHLRSISILICLSSFATTTAGWQFKAIAKQAIPSTAELAAFFGEFNFYAGILSLIVQLALTSRFLKRYGIGPALLVVPVALLLGSAGMVLFGSLAAAVVLKGFDQVFRYSVDKSSVELLYLPVPFDIKVHAKSFIDTVIWRLGDGLAGIGVLVAANYFHATPQGIGWVTLGAVALWVAVALMAHRTYVSSLRDVVQVWYTPAEPPATPAPDAAVLASAEYVLFASGDALCRALTSSDTRTARLAITYTTLTRQTQYASLVIDRLDNPALNVAATEALVRFADSNVEMLCDRLADHSLRLPVRLAIGDVLGRIGTQAAKWALEANLLDPDPRVRHSVTAALHSMVLSQADVEFHGANIAAALAVEIRAHYRSYQLLQQMSGITSCFPRRATELRKAMKMEEERIFRLLGVLYPDRDLDNAHAAIRSRVPAIRDSALELLENTLDPHLRKLLVPLFDDGLSVRERARIATRLFGEESGEPKPAVWPLARNDNSWLRCSGAFAAQAMHFGYGTPAIASAVCHHD